MMDYCRFFEAPGVMHCGKGIGLFPCEGMEALLKWVEEGVVPETLMAISLPDDYALVGHQRLCAYPRVLKDKSGDPTIASSFECASSFA